MSVGQLASELRAFGRTGGAYVGVGPEQNFSYIAALRPDIVFLVDIRRQAIMQHLMYKAIFETSANRSEFVSKLFSLPTQADAARDSTIVQLWARYLPLAADSSLFRRNLDAIYNQLVNVRGIPLSATDSGSIRYVYSAFYALGPGISYSGFGRGGAPPAGTVRQVSMQAANFASLSTLTDSAGVPRSFLATEADFQFLKQLHSRNLIVTIVGDFGGPKALRNVGDWLREHQTVVSAFYTSNVEQYLFSPIDKWNAFYTSVGFMPLDSASVFIRPGGSGSANAAAAAASVNYARSLAAAALYGSAPVAPVPSVQSNVVVQIRPPVQQPPPVVQDPALGWIRGVVQDSATGAAIASTALTVEGTGNFASSDAAGGFTILNLPAGTYTLTARRLGYAPRTVANLRVAAGIASEVVVRVTSMPITYSGVIAGNVVVTSAGSVPAGGQRVQLCPIVSFLAAYQAGRVQRYTDATSCIR
jgi:hypothetical protein